MGRTSLPGNKVAGSDFERGAGACDGITQARTRFLWPVAAFGVGEMV